MLMLDPQSELAAPNFTDPLIALLDELADVIGRLTDEQYVQKPVGVVQSSVGGHVRHCLDHVAALLDATVTGQLDYDNRQRGTAIETSRAAVLHAMAERRYRLSMLPASAIDQPLMLSIMMTGSGPKMIVRTSMGRELSYVLSHTIHHNALIGAMIRTLDGWVPERFGYAPSTIAHLRERTCVLSA